jgi:hypothetical protein
VTVAVLVVVAKVVAVRVAHVVAVRKWPRKKSNLMSALYTSSVLPAL